MRAKLGSDEVHHTLPSGASLTLQSESRERVIGQTAITKNARALFAADGNGLMPLDGADVIWDGRGHLIALR